jgi:ADP-heptose:LPS heptosyltransferase
MHVPTAYRLPPTACRKIAVFRALYLGDLLLAVPALRALRAGSPETEITLIGLPWAASFARRFRRYVDRFVEFGGYPGIDEVAVDPGRSAHFVAEQRAYGYDLVVQMQGSGRTSNPCALALGGRRTAGYYEGKPPPGLTFGAPYPDDQPEVLRNVGLISLLGCPHRGLELEFPLFARDRAEAAALLTPHPPAPSPSRGEGERAASPLPRQGEGPGAARWPMAPPRGLRPRVRAAHGAGRARRARGGRARRPLIGIHAGAHAPARRWPAERFAVVADHLAQRFGAQIVLTGGPGEEQVAQAVAERMVAPALNVAGQTSLGGLAALIDRLDLFVANDTGPAHLADALGTPSVTIFGPADHRRWAPLDQTRHPIVRRPVPCNPCRYTVCPIDHRCLLLLEPGAVIEAAERVLVMGVTACGA